MTSYPKKEKTDRRGEGGANSVAVLAQVQGILLSRRDTAPMTKSHAAREAAKRKAEEVTAPPVKRSAVASAKGKVVRAQAIPAQPYQGPTPGQGGAGTDMVTPGLALPGQGPIPGQGGAWQSCGGAAGKRWGAKGKVVTLLPHEGRLVVELVRGKPFVLDRQLCYRQPLPEGAQGDWELVFDPLGFGAAVSEADDAEPICMKDWLKKQLYADTDDDLWIADSTGDRVQRWCSTERLERHKPIRMAFCIDPVRADKRLDGYELSWPQDGKTRYLWSANHLYTVLGLTTYSGSPSKFVYSQGGQWHKQMQESFGGRHFFWSAHATVPASLARDPVERYLQQPCLSTIGLLDRLLVWAFANPNKGGKRGKNKIGSSKSKCEEVLVGLLRSAGLVQPWLVPLSFDDHWQIEWPKWDGSQKAVTLAVDDRCRIDLHTLFSLPQAFQTRMWFLLRDALLSSGLLEYGRFIDLADLLHTVQAGDELLPIYRQLLWLTSLHIEDILSSIGTEGRISPHAVACVQLDLLSVLKDPRRLDHQLLRHMLAAHAMTDGQISFSICGDKGNILGQSLNNGALALPCNMATLLPPQVVDPSQ